MRILSFDQSTKISAFSWWIDGQYIESGVIDLHKNNNMPERVRAMGIELCNTIAKYEPDKVVIEEVAQQSNAQTLKLLARIQGIIIGFCAANDIDTDIIEPTKWRSQLNFKLGPKVKREELKVQAIKYVKDTYGLKLGEDECEAICIGDAVHKIYGFAKTVDDGIDI